MYCPSLDVHCEVIFFSSHGGNSISEILVPREVHFFPEESFLTYLVGDISRGSVHGSFLSPQFIEAS